MNGCSSFRESCNCLFPAIILSANRTWFCMCQCNNVLFFIFFVNAKYTVALSHVGGDEVLFFAIGLGSVCFSEIIN